MNHSIKNNEYNKRMKSIFRTITAAVMPLAAGAALLALASCSDFFEQESDHVIFSNENHLTNATDTIYSVTGIMHKMQALADRTILLGEARADLVDLTSAANADLRQVALFQTDDNNRYNQPRDYYAVINNCNYFLKMVDDSLKNNRNEYVFLREVAAVRAFRAWTYLQLVLNYGSVPFYTEPLLTKEESDRDYPRYGIKEICEYFIQDLTPYVDVETPRYGTIKSMNSQLFFFPIYIVLGDLNLWAGHYREAALSYYKYISTRNGTNSAYPTGINNMSWNRSDGSWNTMTINWVTDFLTEQGNQQAEIITMIPGDSIPSEGNYSQLRNIFNTSSENNYEVSLVPSKAMIDLSASQDYCQITSSLDTIYAPHNLEDHLSGDLRLYGAWNSYQNVLKSNGDRYTSQTIRKYQTRNIHIYRRTMLYERMAEAMNAAGYPRFAYAILTTGLNNRILERDVVPYYQADSLFLRQFDFPNSSYVVATTSELPSENTQGIHSRGSGFSQFNKFYQLPVDTLITDSLQRIAMEQEAVERMLLDETALEFAFEGTRFYDLMRFALRAGKPAILADAVYARRGEPEIGNLRSQIGVDLYDPNNWYLSWGGKIGIKP